MPHCAVRFVATAVVLAIASFSSLAPSASADLGVDLRLHHCHTNSSAISIDFKCLKQQYSFVSFESWGPHQGVAGNLALCLNTSTQVFDAVDLHIRLCPNCPGAEHKGGFKIMTDLYKVVKEYKQNVNVVWFQVVCHKKFMHAPVKHCGWEKPTFVGAKENLAHIIRLMAYAKVLGFDVGVYTDARAWNYITSNSTVLSSTLGMRLWYKGLDNNPTFNDNLHDFGGWGTASTDNLRKQYKRNQKQCGVANMNLDFEGTEDYDFLTDFDMRGSVDTLSATTFEKTALLAVDMEFESVKKERGAHQWSEESISDALDGALFNAVVDEIDP